MVKKNPTTVTHIVLVANGFLFAFTIFSNFESVLSYLGFFEVLVEQWRVVLNWCWKWAFNILRIDAELSSIEQVTISCSVMVFSPFLIAALQARFIGNPVKITLSLDNALRVVALIPGMLFLLMSWNLSVHQMSKFAFLVELSVITPLGLLVAVLTIPKNTDPEQRFNQSFFLHLVRNSILQLWGIIGVTSLYIVSKIIDLAPPFP